MKDRTVEHVGVDLCPERGLGTAADHIAKLTELRDMGVDQFAIYLMHDAKEATMEAYGREIISALR